MKILLTGGGTGGHITPILAVAHELKRLQPDCQVLYVGERKSKFGHMTQDSSVLDESYTIFAGKFRRYHGESWLRRMLDIKTNVLNIRDALFVFIGIVQSWRLLGKVKPDVVFQKGGFVGVPVGIAASIRRIPLVTHDSDALPGLANRLVSRWVVVHATALPAEYYSYPTAKVLPVGVLVEADYKAVDNVQQVAYKQQLELPADKPLLLVTGGSSGAQRLNEAMVRQIDTLLKRNPDLYVIHQVGKDKATVYGDYTHPRLKVMDFMKPMYVYTGAADTVVARASANTLAELGIQGKATIAVPSPYLTGGHQLKNAAHLEKLGAVLTIQEENLDDPENGLIPLIEKLLHDTQLRHQLGRQMQQITPSTAANQLAKLLVEQASYEDFKKA